MTPAKQFSALADPTRCRVIELLTDRPMPVHVLTAAFSISRPAISRHLRVLKQAGLVKEIKQGRENVYSLQPQRFKPMLAWMEQQAGQARAAPAPAAKTAKAARLPRAVVKPLPKAEPVAVDIVKTVAPKARPKPVAKPAASLMQLDLF